MAKRAEIGQFIRNQSQAFGFQRHVAGPTAHIQHPHPLPKTRQTQRVLGEVVMQTPLQEQAPNLGIGMIED